MKTNGNIVNSKGLIADSSCDLTPEMRKQKNICIIPLNIIVDSKNYYCDDGTVDLALMLNDMKQSKTATQSSCPSIGIYADAMEQFDECFVVTLSSKLSGSYQSAYNAAQMVMEDFPDKKIHVFDSKSASAGETALLLFLDGLIKEEKAFEEIILMANEYIKHSRTLFVLKDLSNLIRNGRKYRA